MKLTFEKMVSQVQRFYYPGGGYWEDIVLVPVLETYQFEANGLLALWFRYAALHGI